MNYGITEHYTEELADWDRILVFHKLESNGFERRLAAVLKDNKRDGLDKEGVALLDLFIVQHQRFDFLHKQVESQQHRLTHNVPSDKKAIENPITNEQNSLRSRMQNIEREFVRTKYNGYLFLSSILTD